MNLVEFWMQSIYLIANILILLAFASYSWLYIDMFLKTRKRCHFYISVGGVLLTFSFLVQLLAALANQTVMPDISYHAIRKLLQTGGLVITLLGVFKEEIPLKPKVKRSSGILLLTGSLINCILALAISGRIFYKCREGESKQFRLSFVFWIILSGYFLIDTLASLGQYYPLLEIRTQPYSVIWVLSQLTLIFGSFVLFSWMGQFISFRVIPQLFLSVWRWVILVSLVSATILSIYMVKLTEDQIVSILEKNVSLIDFNLTQIQDNNKNILSVIAQDQELQNQVNGNNLDKIYSKFEGFTSGNITLDRVYLADSRGVLIFDTEDPTMQGESMTDNLILKKAILDETQFSGYFAKDMLASGDRLVYQISQPIFDENGDLQMVASAQKYIDDQYANLLKGETGQEVIIYVNGMRSASTLLGNDSVARYERMPQEFQGLNFEEFGSSYGQIEILKDKYYVSVKPIHNFESERVGYILVGTRQDLLVKSTRQALFRAFGLAFAISVAMTVPSYYLALRLDKNMSA